MSNDGDPTDYVIQQSKINDVYTIGCYISTQFCSANTLYDDKTFNIYDKGASNLLKMCSEIDYKNPIFKFFLIKGWEMPPNGK